MMSRREISSSLQCGDWKTRSRQYCQAQEASGRNARMEKESRNWTGHNLSKIQISHLPIQLWRLAEIHRRFYHQPIGWKVGQIGQSFSFASWKRTHRTTYRLASRFNDFYLESILIILGRCLHLHHGDASCSQEQDWSRNAR